MRDRVGWFTVCWYSMHFVVWTTVVLALDLGVGLMTWDQVRSGGYAEAQGTVTRCELQGNGKSRELVIEYEYEVDGRQLRNDCYQYGYDFPGGSDREDVCERMPAGSRVTVYYDPANPADSVLIKGLTGFDLLRLLFLMPFNILVADMWLYAVRILVEKDNRYYLWNTIERRVPIRELSRTARFSIVLLLTSLGLLLVTTLVFGKEPPLVFMAVVWGVLAGVGILAVTTLWRDG